MKTKLLLLLALLLVFSPIMMSHFAKAESAGLDGELSEEDKAKFDEILEPVMKIYNFIKYIASVIAAIFLLYAGVMYMSSGSDPKKRDQAKHIATYVIIGLIVIWAAPIIVGLLV
jgi:hypothetical protein